MTKHWINVWCFRDLTQQRYARVNLFVQRDHNFAERKGYPCSQREQQQKRDADDPAPVQPHGGELVTCNTDRYAGINNHPKYNNNKVYMSPLQQHSHQG